MQSRMKKAACLMSLALLLLGGFFVSARVSADETGDWTAAKKAVVKAYKKYQTEVDVTSYNLNYQTEYESLRDMMSQVVNETPGIFYAATSYTVSRTSSTNQIVKIGLGYTDEYKKSDGSIRKKKIKNTQKKIDLAVNEALACVDSGMSKLEKAMILHDYLVSNISYLQNTSKQFRLTEVGAFLKHKANCQGYSLAYGILMDKVGIPVQYVSSTKIAHMWNMIKLNGQWYHVDVTWDDPVDANESLDQYGVVKHDNFLCSSAKMKKNGHSGFDTTAATSTKYDNKYWKNVSCAITYVDGKWLYMTKSGVTERDKLASGSKQVVYNVSGSTLVPFTGSKFYFIAYNSIYLYDYNTNSAAAVWKTSSKYSEEYILTQLKYSDGYVYYRLLYQDSHVNGKLIPKEDGSF